MNRINYNKTGGFPLDTDILNAVQEAYSVFNHLGELSGNQVSDGIIFFNGEILTFKGGTLGASIIIKEESESRIFEDGATKPVIFRRYATFGSSTPDKTFAWADFKRFDNLIKISDKNNDFEKRIKALETKKSPIPIGLIAIWGKPETEPIPEGWQEYTDLRGRFPLGWNPDDEEFNEILKPGGEKDHILTIDEMPSHTHGFPQSRDAGDSRLSNQISTDPEDYKGKGNTEATGGNQPHNNMPPYRIIRYIVWDLIKIKAK